MFIFAVQGTNIDACLSSLSDAVTRGEAGGMTVDYETLPEAIVPIMADVFHAPLTVEEQYYAKEVGMPPI